MVFQLNDGGRYAAGFRGKKRDCVARAIAIAADLPYTEVYIALNKYADKERVTSKMGRRSSSSTGVHTKTAKKYLADLGFQWVPTMKIGSGCKVHVRADELPKGRLVLNLSRHFAAFIDGVLHDNHDSSRGGTRCVYGYWVKA